jgi:hypothetical protein
VKFLGNENFYRLAQQFVTAVAEHLLRDAVQKDDPALCIHLHDSVRSGFQ